MWFPKDNTLNFFGDYFMFNLQFLYELYLPNDFSKLQFSFDIYSTNKLKSEYFHRLYDKLQFYKLARQF